MSKSEERRKVVTASYSFFKSAEQVTVAVSRLDNSCCLGTLAHFATVCSKTWPGFESVAARLQVNLF